MIIIEDQTPDAERKPVNQAVWQELKEKFNALGSPVLTVDFSGVQEDGIVIDPNALSGLTYKRYDERAEAWR